MNMVRLSIVALLLCIRGMASPHSDIFWFRKGYLTPKYRAYPGYFSDTTRWVAKNAVFAEYWGAGGINPGYSVNYDRLLDATGNFRTSIRIGANIPARRDNYLNSFPVMFNLLFGGKFSFEMGGGFVLIYYDRNYKANYHAITTVFGLRYEDIRRGIFARVGLTPTIGHYPGDLYESIVGASVGVHF